MHQRSIIFALITALLAFAPVAAGALARAPFPSASRLQPIPADVAPNISGNVHSSLQPAAAPPTSAQANTAQDNTVNPSPALTREQGGSIGGGPGAWIFFATLALVFAFSAAWIIRQK